MTDKALNAPSESSSLLKKTFSRIIETALVRPSHHKVLKASWLETKLGPMVGIADEDVLYLLEFADSQKMEREIKRLMQKTSATILLGNSPPLRSIEGELNQ